MSRAIWKPPVVAAATMAALQCVASALAEVPSATSAKTLASGVLGELRIGMSVRTLEARLGKKVQLAFAGDNRAGLSIEKKQDLLSLKIAQVAGVPAQGADLLMTDRNGELRVEMVVLGVPCSSVAALETKLRTSAEAVRKDDKGGWSNHDQRYKYVWGAETKPVCRFLLRDG